MAFGSWYQIHVVVRVRPLMIVGQASNLAIYATGMAPGPKTLLWSMIDRRLTANVAPPPMLYRRSPLVLEILASSLEFELVNLTLPPTEGKVFAMHKEVST